MGNTEETSSTKFLSNPILNLDTTEVNHETFERSSENLNILNNICVWNNKTETNTTIRKFHVCLTEQQTNQDPINTTFVLSKIKTFITHKHVIISSGFSRITTFSSLKSSRDLDILSVQLITKVNILIHSDWLTHPNLAPCLFTDNLI